PNNSQPFAFPKQTILYTLTVTDTASNYLCKTSGTDNILITVDDCPPEIPNVFTPNGDGINDEFVISNLSEGSSVNIYDRWGILVWSTLVRSPSPSGRLGGVWDGRTTAGLECTEGVYYYLINTSGGKMYKGFLELVR
ncbi:MAG: gliding motility-associated C-terminal domain-containing protein, partial [Bacteroidota bacterium]